MEKLLAPTQMVLEIIRDEPWVGGQGVDIGNVVDDNDGSRSFAQVSEDRRDHLEVLAVPAVWSVAPTDVVVEDDEVVIGEALVTGADRLDAVAAMGGHIAAEAFGLAGPLQIDVPQVGMTASTKIGVGHEQAAAGERIERVDVVERMPIRVKDPEHLVGHDLKQELVSDDAPWRERFGGSYRFDCAAVQPIWDLDPAHRRRIAR